MQNKTKMKERDGNYVQVVHKNHGTLKFHKSPPAVMPPVSRIGSSPRQWGGKGGESYLIYCCLNTFNSICTLGDFLGQLLHMAIHRVIADMVITVMRFVRTVIHCSHESKWPDKWMFGMIRTGTASIVSPDEQIVTSGSRFHNVGRHDVSLWGYI